MTINVGKFAAFISRISSITVYVFEPYQCEELFNSIQCMSEEVIAPSILVYADFKTVDALLMVMNGGTQKIEAIKLYRILTGMGLKESKDAIEKYWPTKPFEERLRPAVSN